MTGAVPPDAAQVTSIGNGYFSVGGKTVNLSQMMQMVNWSRIDSLDELSAVKADLMNQISAQIKALSALYMKAEANKSHKDASHDDEGSDTEFKLKGYGNEQHSFEDWCKKFGIEEIDVNPNDDQAEWSQEWETNAQAVNDAISELKTASEKLYTEAKDINNQREDKISQTNYSMNEFHRGVQGILQG